MRIAILSDTHDHIPNLRSAVTYCNAYSVQMMIHCGDLISPFMLDELARFGGAVHLVYGNNIGDARLSLITTTSAANNTIVVNAENIIDGSTIVAGIAAVNGRLRLQAEGQAEVCRPRQSRP